MSNEIIIGSLTSPLYTFDNDQLSKVSGIFAVDTVGNQMSVDTVKAELRYNKDAPALYITSDNKVYVTSDGRLYLLKSPLGDIRLLPYGTPIWWRNNGTLICAGFVRNVERIGRYRYRINIFSGLGLLQAIYHVGGVYTGQTFAQIAAEIIGDTFAYTISPAIADLPVYGWLPYDTRRNNLHQLTFPLGVALRRDEAGNPTFVFLSTDNPKQVPEGRVSFGGTVDYESPATRVDVTEHAFFAADTDETVTLFDNTGGSPPVVEAMVIFDQAPIHDLVATGSLQIVAQHVNYAVVTGTGTLEGKLYTHTRRIVSQAAQSADATENVKRVEDMTLVSLANSQNVAKRVLAYYSSAKTVRAKIQLSGERCGDLLSMLDPYYDQMQAFLQEVSVNASTDLQGTGVLIEGYTPTGQGNNVTGVETLTGAGTWVSPFDGEVTVLVVQAGTGGGVGGDGEAAPIPAVSSQTSSVSDSTTYYRGLLPENCVAGAGGQPGTPGAGGKVYLARISVTQGQRISYSCGVGGAGAPAGSGRTQGNAGGETTFGTISSAAGAVSASGYIDPISGEQLAIPGAAGMSGGKGVGYEMIDGVATLVTPPAIVFNGVAYNSGGRGPTVTDSGGTWSTGYGSYRINLEGGFGGGPAAGGNGKQGQSGSGSITYSNSVARGAVADASPGGAGADATAPSKATTPGRGGTGGHGGGGGGAFGYINSIGNTVAKTGATAGTLTFRAGITAGYLPAAGGAGSAGGQGADGIIRLYY